LGPAAALTTDPAEDVLRHGSVDSSTGVAECDAYVAAVERCMVHLSERTRELTRRELEKQKDDFRESALTPQGRMAVKGDCKKMFDGVAHHPACN
jgi:hypothetical protein